MGKENLKPYTIRLPEVHKALKIKWVQILSSPKKIGAASFF